MLKPLLRLDLKKQTVSNIEAVAQDMNVDTPDVPDEFMNVAETTGGKRASETENDRIKKGRSWQCCCE